MARGGPPRTGPSAGARSRIAPDRSQEAGLADAGLAGQLEELAMAVGGLGDAPARKLQLLVAADEKRRDQWPEASHGR
jgi:hypothetical protein